MRNRQILYLFILISLTFNISAQTNADKTDIYKIVLLDQLDTLTKVGLTPICILDSTCEVGYQREMPDSVFEKYFKIGKNDYAAKSKVRISFIDSSGQFEKLKDNLLIDRRIFVIKTSMFKEIFSPCINIMSNINVCWDKFQNKFKAKGYCKISKPYFYNSETALVYCYYLVGPLTGSGYVFLIIKENNIWKIKSRICQWIA